MLPIQFKTRFRKEELKDLTSTEILDVIQNWLEEKGFRYINRKENKIVFHKADGWHSINARSFLVSGVIKIKDKKEELVIINGNWMVFLIALPFLLFILIADSRYSTFDKGDVSIIWVFFFVIFGGNLVTRIIAHWGLKSEINKMIKNYT
jgi:hypothetical protein